MIKFAIKVGIAGGTVYYLSSVGVWKESTESTKIYGKINTVLGPHIHDLKKQLPLEIPDLPKSERISYLCRHYWNQAVFASFKSLSELPEHSSKWTQAGYNFATNNEEIRKFIQSFSVEKSDSK